MKRRWRRLILITIITILAAVLVGLGLAIWLYQSGRLASLSQNLLQHLSGQEITLERIEFPTWNVVAFTKVHLQQRLPGWQLTIECPRVEARYGPTGLLNKRVDRVYLVQPQVALSRRVDLSASAKSVRPLGSQPVTALPLNRLFVQRGRLQVHWDNRVYTIHQLDAALRSQRDHQLQVEASGRLEDSDASLRVVAHLPLDKSQPAGDLQVTVRTVPASLLTEVFSNQLPPTWKVLQGALDLSADLNLQDGILQGNVTTSAGQLTAQAQSTTIRQATFSYETRVQADFGQRQLRLDGKVHVQMERVSRASDITITNLSLSTEVSLEADFEHQTLSLRGQARLRAEHASQAPNTTIAELSLSTPWRLSHTPAGWLLTATPAFQSHTVRVGTLLHVSRPSVKTSTPLQVRYHDSGLQIQGAPELAAETLELHMGGQTESILRVTGVHGQLSLQSSPSTIDITDARLHTQTWYWQTTEQTELLKAVSLQGSGAADLKDQRLTIRQLTAELPELGRVRGSAAWHWPSHTVHDVQITVAPTTVEALHNSFKNWLPAAYASWHLAGHTELTLRLARLSLRSPRRLQNLVAAWQIRDGAFNSSDGVVAGEHVNGQLQATVSIDPAAGQYALQGTLTLQPFAVLVGSMFPALEENRMTSVVTFSVGYSGSTERLQVYLAGQFHDLAMVTLQGAVHQVIRNPQVDMQLHLRGLRAERFWKTFMSDPVRFPTLSQARVQGTLNAAVALQGQPTHLDIRGMLDVAEAQFQNGTIGLQGLSLLLPLQMQYPLPETVPQTAAPPPEAYGRLSIASLRIERVEFDGLSLGLMLQSDTLLFRHGIVMPLWGGQIALESITAQRLLRPDRRIALQARLRHLDLRRVPRHTAKLPLAGVINADFPQVQIRGDQLETQGSLTIELAGGVIRVDHVQGRDLLTALPTLQGSLRTEQPLSLSRLTDIYAIGDISGTMAFSVTDLLITAGEPAAFSLEFAVQEKGGESREITLRALNNLLFTTGSAKVASGLLGDTYRLPYRRFGAEVMLRHDTLRLRGKYHDREGLEYFMQAPSLGGGVSIVNRVPQNGIPFRDFLQRLKATVLEKPSVQVK